MAAIPVQPKELYGIDYVLCTHDHAFDRDRVRGTDRRAEVFAEAVSGGGEVRAGAARHALDALRRRLDGVDADGTGDDEVKLNALEMKECLMAMN